MEEEQLRKNAVKGAESNNPKQSHDIECLKSEMNLQDESIPILNVCYLRRLKDDTSPNPPRFRRIVIKRSSPTHWSTESDHEKEIELTDKIKRLTFEKTSENEFDDNNSTY